MDRQVTSIKIMGTIGWLLFRLLILNALIIALIFILAVLRNIFEPTNPFVIRFSLQLYITALFLVNLVYIIGNTYETIYLRLWNKKINVRDFEKKFFKAGLITTLIVNTAGVVMYFINHFGQ